MKTNIFQPSFTLTENDLIDAHQSCPICLNEEMRHVDITIQETPLVKALFCHACKGLSASKIPKKEALDAYYAEYYEHNELMVTFHNPNRFAKHILKYIDNNILKKRIRILDFGGGDGSLSIAMADILLARDSHANVEIDLVDYIREEIEGCLNPLITFKIHENLDTLNEPYDIILASGVIEHLTFPHTAIIKLFSLLHYEGFFYARTPFTSPFKRLYPKLDMNYPAHFHDLGASFWNRFIQTFNLDCQVVISQPSIVETQFSKAFMITLIACLLKFPAYIERFLLKQKLDMIWNYYGGWEVIFKRSGKG